MTSAFSVIRRTLVRANNGIERAIGPRRRPIMQDYLEELTNAVATRPGLQALHFGCGRDIHKAGQFVAEAGVHVVGLDVDPIGLELNPAVHKVLRTSTRLPFRDSTFDLVFAEYVFEHLTDPWANLVELSRVTKPGGSLVILVPNRNHYYAKVTVFTPLWFHRAYLRLQGVPAVELDTFKTAHLWGSLKDITETSNRTLWKLAEVRSMPGPTEYTLWLPFHLGFVVLDKVLSRWQSMHLDYVVRYRKVIKDDC